MKKSLRKISAFALAAAIFGAGSGITKYDKPQKSPRLLKAYAQCHGCSYHMTRRTLYSGPNGALYERYCALCGQSYGTYYQSY